MKRIFSKTSFPKAPGGNLYEWIVAESMFDIDNNGLFAIKISAQAKNAEQNISRDDDDLRISLDDYHFGKYEQHKEKISWKGFGTSSSWDGASLKGGTKIIYFFAELSKGSHKIKFFADGTPAIQNLEIFEINDRGFELKNFEPPEQLPSKERGIPWLAFVFLGAPAKTMLIDANVKSAKENNGSDGDNLKIVINGKILQNKKAPTSNKYKNFYFSGDIKDINILSLSNENLAGDLAFENAIELWYDQKPKILNLSIKFYDIEDFLKKFDLDELKNQILRIVYIAIAAFKINKNKYSAQFLLHSLVKNPENLTFKANHPIIKKIKTDPTYGKIFNKVKEKISQGIFSGEIWPDEIDNGINFDSEDLATSIHGIHKIEYNSERVGKDRYNIVMNFFDIYDFQKIEKPFYVRDYIENLKTQINNTVDVGEVFGIVNNFEIQITTKDVFYVR